MTKKRQKTTKNYTKTPNTQKTFKNKSRMPSPAKFIKKIKTPCKININQKNGI
jgi:hypothetical protein